MVDQNNSYFMILSVILEQNILTIWNGWPNSQMVDILISHFFVIITLGDEYRLYIYIYI
jgi:hypothetical protein